jgi:hypothetical protein
MAPARPGLIGNALGSIAIVALVAFIAFGLPLLDRTLPATRTLPPGARFAVGGGVTLVPPAGAALDVSQSRPGPQRGAALFIVGPVRVAVVAAPFTGALSQADRRLRDQIAAKPGYRVDASETPVRSRAGVDGLAGRYTAPGRTGSYAVFVADGRTVNMTASGPGADLGRIRPAVEASVRTLAFAAAS